MNEDLRHALAMVPMLLGLLASSWISRPLWLRWIGGSVCMASGLAAAVWVEVGAPVDGTLAFFLPVCLAVLGLDILFRLIARSRRQAAQRRAPDFPFVGRRRPSIELDDDEGPLHGVREPRRTRVIVLAWLLAPVAFFLTRAIGFPDWASFTTTYAIAFVALIAGATSVGSRRPPDRPPMPPVDGN